jgi:F-type H+-transporting ATPase subunit delta
MILSKRAKQEGRQLYRACLENGLLDEDRVGQTVQRLIASGYRSGPAALAHFLRLVKLDRARHSANIESAAPLPEDLQASVRVDLTKLYGPGIRTEFSHNPALIGGMRILVGCDLYDGSVLGRLAALERSF